MTQAMRTKLIRIGNSRGVRLPKAILEQAGLERNIVSPDELNERVSTVIVAPMTARGRPYPTRVACRFAKDARIVLDQMRTVDKHRLRNHMGTIDAATRRQVLAALAALFAP